MRSFANFLFKIIKGGEIWVKEKVQPLKIIYALFLEPHILCYVMLKNQTLSFSNNTFIIFAFCFQVHSKTIKNWQGALFLHRSLLDNINF